MHVKSIRMSKAVLMTQMTSTHCHYFSLLSKKFTWRCSSSAYQPWNVSKATHAQTSIELWCRLFLLWCHREACSWSIQWQQTQQLSRCFTKQGSNVYFLLIFLFFCFAWTPWFSQSLLNIVSCESSLFIDTEIIQRSTRTHTHTLYKLY